MRIDHMRSLIRRHTNPSVPFSFPHFGFLHDWCLIPSRLFSATFFSSHTAEPDQESFHLFVPVHPAGGGGGCKALAQDTNMVDIPSPDEIESTRLLFSHNEWIATGKIWSKTLPPHVQLAFTDTQKLPTRRLDFIPQPNISVSDLSALTTLPSSSVSGPNSVILLPSASPPTVFIRASDDVFNHTIFFGGESVLTAFDKLGLEQAWLSGCKSITLNGHPDQYPLWTRAFVRMIQLYRADRSRWEVAQSWLDAVAVAQADSSAIETPDVIDECRIRFSVVPWSHYWISKRSSIHGQSPCLVFERSMAR
jgi:hypothetical protein